METEKFCLRWNDFESNISSAFRDLRTDKDFFDITLACEDELIQAHKVILSACSPFFRDLLRRHQHQNPLLYLKGVKYSDIQSVLNFMYHGEVNVAQENLNSFLAVAEDLKVKGLTQNQSEDENPRKKNQIPSNPLPAKEITSTKKQPSSSTYTVEDNDVEEIVPVKSEPADTMPSQAIAHQHQQKALTSPEENYMAMAYQEEGNYEDYEQYEAVQEYVPTRNIDQHKGGLPVQETPEGFQCLVCGVVIKHMENFSRHYRDRHTQQESHVCVFCNKSYKTKHSMETHQYNYHKEEVRSMKAGIVSIEQSSL